MNILVFYSIMKTRFYSVLGVYLLLLPGTFLYLDAFSVNVTNIPGLRIRYSNFSKEAEDSGLAKFLEKVQSQYYILKPYMIGMQPEVSLEVVRNVFQPYNASYHRLKIVTDGCRKLLKEMDSIKVDRKKLKLVESRLIHQLRFLLETNFGSPYDDYYNGLWLLGPDYLCEHPVCDFAFYLHAALEECPPTTYDDLELIRGWLLLHKLSFRETIHNVMMGVLSGMTSSEEVCKASLNSLKGRYWNLMSLTRKEAQEDIFFSILFNKKYYNSLEEAAIVTWEKSYGVSVMDGMYQALIEGFVQPYKELVKYLTDIHIRHCPPEEYASGLSWLPLSNIFISGYPDSTNTTGKLPTGEQLDGKKAYLMLLQYYTSTNLSIDDIYSLGQNKLKETYPTAVDLAMKVTGEGGNETLAIKYFKDMIDSDEQFFNDGPFPKNESDSKAMELCQDEESAKMYCPVRWKTMQKWFKSVREIMSRLSPLLVNLFYHTGPEKTVPTCPVSLRIDFNPSAGVQSYLESDEFCSYPAQYFLPFFNDRFGPKYQDVTTSGHEAMPGHHLQVQGYLENFEAFCNIFEIWLSDIVPFYHSFTEGWGVYAESPLLNEDLKIYSSDPLGKYGVAKWQIWRGLRIIVDIGLHYKRLTGDDARLLFKNYTWDTSDAMQKEVTRYQGAPAQATAYLVGQQMIIELRRRAEKALGDKFDLKDFHFHLLSQSQAPLSHLILYIDDLIECIQKEKTDRYCNSLYNEMPEDECSFDIENSTMKRKYEYMVRRTRVKKRVYK